MILQIADVLDQATLGAVLEASGEAVFDSGSSTAGWAARSVKNNLQAADEADTRAILEMVGKRLREHALIRSAARPKEWVRLTLSRYDSSMAYGTHVDNAFIEGRRTDCSFTLFLSAPDDYDGGELVLEETAGERAFKLDAGDLLLYPSTTLHRVAPVTRGSRLVVVGWITSRVRDAGQREILFDIERSMRAEHEARGKTQQFDRLSKTLNNLMRMWAD